MRLSNELAGTSSVKELTLNRSHHIAKSRVVMSQALFVSAALDATPNHTHVEYVCSISMELTYDI